MISAVQAVITTEAVKRKPSKYKVTSFFGSYDFWRYHAVFDKKLCQTCMDYAKTQYFVGSHLRARFQYLEIENVNMIKVKVHPHCRCELHRITDPAEYLMVLNLFGR